jgi:uncharacterized protein YndB with AHSA1/START domain
MDDIVLERTYPYSIAQVWKALTDPAALAEWLMPGDFKAVVGHRVRFHCEPRAEFDGTVDVVVLEVDEPRRLRYSWKTSDMKTPTIVTWTLVAAADGGTRLRLEHTGFEGDNGRMTHPLFKGGWGEKLGTLLPRVLGVLHGRRES